MEICDNTCKIDGSRRILIPNDVKIVEEVDKTLNSTESLTSKPKTKAKVWQYFGLEVDNTGEIRDINTPVCWIGNCHACVKTTKHSSTTNLYSHLKL